MGSRLPLSHLKTRLQPPLKPRLKRSIGKARGVLVALSVALAVGLGAQAAQAAPPPMPKSAKARKHFDAAVERYKAQDFDGAAAEAGAGLAIEEHESLLFIKAQAERQRGNCIDAVDDFTKFIAATSNEDMRQNALTAKALCAEELAESARLAELAAAAEEEEEEPELEPEPEPDLPPPAPATPWFRDPLGGALVGVGGAMVLAGSGVLIASEALLYTAPTYGSFGRRVRTQPTLQLAGGVVLGAGALLAIGGAVRWVVVAKRGTKATPSARMQLGPWLDPRRAGVVIRGRF